MVVLCLCHGGHVWVARDIAPGKMQSHFACNTGGWFLDSHVQIYLITPSMLYNNSFSCLGDGGCLSDLVRYINVLLCLDMKYNMNEKLSCVRLFWGCLGVVLWLSCG